MRNQPPTDPFLPLRLPPLHRRPTTIPPSANLPAPRPHTTPPPATRAAVATIQVSSPLVLVAGTAAGGQENISAALNRIYNLVPQAILFKYGNKGLKFHVSYLTQQIYEQDLLLGTYKNQDTTEKGINRYKGYDVVPLAGMPDNTIVATITEPGMESNLWIGCNSDQDETGLQLARLQANSELFFIKGLFKMDTQIGFPDFAVLYTNITA